jgi:hypothetical protein
MSHKVVPKETRRFMTQTNPLRTGAGKRDPPGEQTYAQAMRLKDDTRIVRLANLKEGEKRHPGKKGNQARKKLLEPVLIPGVPLLPLPAWKGSERLAKASQTPGSQVLLIMGTAG